MLNVDIQDMLKNGPVEEVAKFEIMNSIVQKVCLKLQDLLAGRNAMPSNHFTQLLCTITKMWCRYIYIPFNCYLASPQPILGHYQKSSPIHSMLISTFTYLTWTSSGTSQRGWVTSPAWQLVSFEQGNFKFWLKCLNPLDHSPLICIPTCVSFISSSIKRTQNFHLGYHGQVPYIKYKIPPTKVL